jgi:hypothetical protein
LIHKKKVIEYYDVLHVFSSTRVHVPGKKKQRGEKERQVVHGGHGLDIQKKARLNFRMIFGQYWSGL